MAGIKIVDLPALGRDLAATDLLELSLAGGTGSRKITGQEIINASKLNVGTTPIINGTAGRILFQSSGDVLGQSGNLFWDNTNGRLGVGTSIPSVPLQVLVNNQNIVARFEATGTGEGNIEINGLAPQLRATTTNGASGFRVSVFGATTGDILRVQDSSTTLINVKKTGNLLINTTTDAGYKLDVNGTARVSGNTTFGGTIGSGGDSNFVIAAGNFAVNITSNNPMNGQGSLITTGAITTTDSQTKNVINVNNAVTSTLASFNTLNGFAFTSTINQTLGTIRGLFIAPTLTASTDFRAIETTVGNVLLGTTSGNVGIGTTTPDTYLTENKVLTIFNATSSQISLVGSRGTDDILGTISFWNGTTRVGDINTIRDGALGNGAIRFRTSNSSTLSERMRINTSGNVLINTTTDAGYRLDVSGTARISGDISTNQYFYGAGLRSGNASFWNEGGIGSTVDGVTFANSFNLAGAKTLWFRGDPRFAHQTTPASVYYFGARYSGSGGVYIPCDFMKLQLSSLESFGISSGTNTSNALNINLNLNYTGGTSTVRGIYYNPTLTSMTGVSHFAFHSTSGRVRFEGLPTSPTGLNAGDLWNDAGTLKIV